VPSGMGRALGLRGTPEGDGSRVGADVWREEAAVGRADGREPEANVNSGSPSASSGAGVESPNADGA
ncbi:MAG: hypothetical protein ABIP53_08965, partial [Candidatus Limnocylindrales bacterium]